MLSAGCVITDMACLPTNRVYDSRSMRAYCYRLASRYPPEFNVYVSCQLQIKLTGTPSALYTRWLGSVWWSKADVPGPSVRGAWESLTMEFSCQRLAMVKPSYYTLLLGAMVVVLSLLWAPLLAPRSSPSQRLGHWPTTTWSYASSIADELVSYWWDKK